MKSEVKTALVLIVAIVGGMGVLSVVFSSLDQSVVSNPGDGDTGNYLGVDTLNKLGLKQAPELVGIAHYLNTSPEELKETMKDKVILYDIWTYSCINCIRTLPYITAWNEKYSDQGLLVLGIHSPEFEFEKDVKNVEMAIEKYGIIYPVVLDNDMETWKAFENRYWPRKYIADHEGFIRYDHIGEGGYAETEKVIQNLLKERSESLGIQSDSANALVDIEEFEHTAFRTPELYFGYNFAQNRNQLGNSEGFQPGNIVTYAKVDNVDLHKFYLEGEWKNYGDSMELISETGSIKLLYAAKEVNIVTENDAELEISLDGKPISDKLAGTDVISGLVTVSEPDLYNIVSSDISSTHLMEIEVSGKGFQIFTFTFG